MPETTTRSNRARPEPGLGFSVGLVHSGALSTPPDAATAECVGALCGIATRSHRPLPRLRWPVQAGFPSPAEDDQDAAIDLNELLAPHPEACFLLRVRGCSMADAGIDDGDLLLVDRALEPSHGRIVIAVIDGEFTVKRLHRQAQVVRLEAAHAQYPPIELKDGQELQVWGVVTRVIKTL
ncbi:MAG: translesion error-prone DNA polymerase V autoproteolytic subunit [Gammaproteobacteria bacterium]|nr:translesion error-prone DNA polymerase V autoproteolytic subunit [Gammaproteobacteria bacterium]